jgi:hypothetical protein
VAIGMTLHGGGAAPLPTANEVAVGPVVRDSGTALVNGRSQREAAPSGDFVHFYEAPIVAATQRLTTDVVALEAARQMEQRYGSAQRGLQRLERRQPAEPVEHVVNQVFDDAKEFASFGELLLDLRDRKRLQFTEPSVDADLTVAVHLLAQVKQRQRDMPTVREVLAPALRSSRLTNLSDTIMVRPLDAPEERDVLVRLNNTRPEVFARLFIVFGTADNDFMALGARGFVLDDGCGPSWVAPRSLVEENDGRMHIWIRQQTRAR